MELQVITMFWMHMNIKRRCCVPGRVAGGGGNVIREAKGLSWGFSHLQGIGIINVSVLLSLFPWQEEKWSRTEMEQMHCLASAAGDLWGPQMMGGWGESL